jgi:hypothetical protein
VIPAPITSRSTGSVAIALMLVDLVWKENV